MKQINKITIVHKYDQDTDLSYLKQDYFNDDPTKGALVTQEENQKYKAQDKARLERYESGELYDIGIYAIAEIIINETIQHIRSGGLWGVQCDSEEGYFKEVESDELDNLKTQLKELGFKSRYINEMVKLAVHEGAPN